MNSEPFDQSKANAFGDNLVATLNHGALALMLSIGHRTGLFDVMRDLPPSSSSEIAEQAGLQERYVREWLGAMVTGGVVDYDANDASYRLPAEHAGLLTRAARPSNIAATMQWIPVLGNVEDEIIECFEKGGGVPYSSYERFHAVMMEESDQTVVAALIDSILPCIPDGIVRLERGIDVLDVGCGSGRALITMAKAFPKSRFTGYDFSHEGIGIAQSTAEQAGLSNIQFRVADAAKLVDVQAFDLITAFDAIHDQAKPADVLAGIARALRPEGVFLMQDIRGSSHVDRDRENPMAPFLYTISCLHCMTVSLSSDGDGLGAMWGEETACRMLAEAGFGEVTVKQLPHDDLNNYFLARK